MNRIRNISMAALLLASFLSLIMISGCKKHKDDPIVYYTANCTIKGVPVQFKTTSTFNRLCLLTGVCNQFYVDPGNTGINSLFIGLPWGVYSGMNLKNGDDGIQIVYYDAQGRGFFSTKYDSLAIHIDEWQGHGGWAKGTFTAKLRYSSMDPPAYDSLTLKGGTFESRIWYYFP